MRCCSPRRTPWSAGPRRILSALIHPGFIYVNARGMSFDKAAYVERFCVSGEVLFKRQDVQELRVREFPGLRDRHDGAGRGLPFRGAGRDGSLQVVLRVLQGRGSLALGGRPDDGHARIKSGSKWRLFKSCLRSAAGRASRSASARRSRPSNSGATTVSTGPGRPRRLAAGRAASIHPDPKIHCHVDLAAATGTARGLAVSTAGLARSAAIRSAIAGNEVSILELAASASARTLVSISLNVASTSSTTSLWKYSNPFVATKKRSVSLPIPGAVSALFFAVYANSVAR